MTNGRSQEFDIEKMKNPINKFQAASLKRTLNKICCKCERTLGEVGGIAFRTSSHTWYCGNCNPLRRA